MAIVKNPNELYIEYELPETGERIAVSISELFGRIWDEYVRGMMDNAYCRGLLADMTLTPCEVFHMMERLQLGKAEFDAGDYQERSYI
jgi:hypothetical protein